MKANQTTPTKSQIVLTQVVGALLIIFILGGAVWYGVSPEVFGRAWQNLLERPGGPMTFRFFLQPIMATITAVLAGIADARAGRDYFLWTIVTNPEKRSGRLYEGLVATSRIILLGLVMDLIYQYVVFDTFHPGEAAIIALLLAFVPYLLLRGPAARVASWWLGRQSAGEIR